MIWFITLKKSFSEWWSDFLTELGRQKKKKMIFGISVMVRRFFFFGWGSRCGLLKAFRNSFEIFKSVPLFIWDLWKRSVIHLLHFFLIFSNSTSVHNTFKEILRLSFSHKIYYELKLHIRMKIKWKELQMTKRNRNIYILDIVAF